MIKKAIKFLIFEILWPFFVMAVVVAGCYTVWGMLTNTPITVKMYHEIKVMTIYLFVFMEAINLFLYYLIKRWEL